MNRRLTTNDCIQCWLAKGVATGCRPTRKTGEKGRCSHCNCNLPPVGQISKTRYFEIHKNEDGSLAHSGLFALVLVEEGPPEWFLVSFRDLNSPNQPNLGASSEEIKDWLAKHKMTITWPPIDPLYKKFKPLNIKPTS